MSDLMSPSLYRKTELSNGLTIVTEEIPHVRSVALGVWVTVGSRDEHEFNNGISHFLEHMLFKGTNTRNTQQIAATLENVGGTLDAFTSKELTCFYAHVLDEHLHLAIEILSDIIINSLLNSSDIEKEKEVVLKEINHYKDTPDEMVFEYFYQNIYEPHPLGFFVHGTENNIKQFYRDDLINFHAEQYAANRIVVVAAGNLQHEQVLSLVEKYFSILPLRKPRQLIDVPVIRSKSTVVEDNCTQAHVCMGTRAFAYDHEKKFPLMILNSLLGDGMSSLLFQKIREEFGLVYSIYSFYDFFIDSGIFGIYFSTEEKHINQVFELIRQELFKVKSNYVTENILQKMKNQIKGNIMLGLESTTARMNRLAKNEIYLNHFYSLDDVLQKIEDIRIDEVVEVAHELFCEDCYFSTILKSSQN